MIVFFDILLLDDDNCLIKPHRLRRLLLKETVEITPGRAEISEQEIIDFSRPDAIRHLQLALSRSIAERWEGYVIKACDEPYFSVLSERSDGFGRWIKLKKDYIPGLGDTADFAVIGARYDAKNAPSLSTKRQLSWTHFFIGCLDNKEDVVRLSASPRFRIVDMIGIHSLSVNDMQVLNQWGKFVACDVDSNTAFDCYSIHNSLPNMDVAFKTPFVVELLGSGFDKPSNAQYYTLRFPRVLKIHWDRAFEDAISFVELQDLAEKARAVPADELEEENALWLEKVAGTNRKNEYIVDKSQTTSTSSFTCTSPLSKSASLISLGLTPPSVKQAPASLIRDNNHNRRSFSQSLTTYSLNKRKHTISPVYPPPTLDSASELNTISSNLPPASCLKRLKITVSTSSATMEHSSTMDLDHAPQHSHRAPGSPIPRAWASSVDSDSANPSSQAGQTPSGLGSGFTTPLRENSNLLLHEVPTRAVATFEEAWKFISEAEAEAEVETESCPIPSPEHELYDFSDFFLNDHVYRPMLPLRDHPISPLTTVPIYCGESSFHEDTFRKASREFTFSAKHFVKSLGFSQTHRRLHLSNPAAASNAMALGIVLVDTNDASTVLAMQLYDIGNLLASELAQSNTTVPIQGKIFFLDSRILKAGIDNKMFLLNDWWSEYGTQYFYATISWREGGNATQVVSGPRRLIDQINYRPEIYAPTVPRGPASIVNLYESSDVEVLGEFVSIDPTVHLHGERFYAPYPSTRNVPATATSHEELHAPIATRNDHQMNDLVSRYSSSAFV
jgi:DNA ligase-4